jgi:hypothetical protein
MVGEVSVNLCSQDVVAWSVQRIPTAVTLGFLGRNLYFFIQATPELSSDDKNTIYFCP